MSQQRLVPIDRLKQYEVGKIRDPFAAAGLLQPGRQLLAAHMKQSRQFLEKPLQRLLTRAVETRRNKSVVEQDVFVRANLSDTCQADREIARAIRILERVPQTKLADAQLRTALYARYCVDSFEFAC